MKVLTRIAAVGRFVWECVCGFGKIAAKVVDGLLCGRRGLRGHDDLVRRFEVVHAGEHLFVFGHGWKEDGGAAGIEASGIFDGKHGHGAVDEFELRAVALQLAFADELFVDGEGDL